MRASDAAHARVGTLTQIGTITKYNFLNYFRARRFYVMLAIIVIISGLLTGIGGLMLAGQVGIGSPSTGTDYTLMSITVVVLGGTSVAGGRGSFVSTLFGAALVQATSSASSYINANSSVHYTVIGALTLLAAIIFSLARRRAASG